MIRFMLNKLVRDKIPADQVRTNQNPVYYKLDPTEHAEALVAKLIEEAQEISVADVEHATEEIADVQQVIDDLKALLSIADEDVIAAQSAKREKSGGFADGMYVESVRVEEGSSWADYYRTDPKRFIEIDEVDD